MRVLRETGGAAALSSRLLDITRGPQTQARPAARPTTLAGLIDRTPELPTMPSVALATHKETSRSGASAASVAALVATDPALTARVLRLANSAYYGNVRGVAAVSDAVLLLGMKAVRNLCLLAGTYPWLKGGLPAYEFGPGDLLDHSLTAAVASRTVAEGAGFDGEVAFTAGLLHDLGKVALALWFTPLDGAIRGREDERRVLGFDHGATGGELARRWNLPQELVAAIACHHMPCGGLEDVVHLGDALAHALAGGKVPEIDPEALARLRLSPDALPGMLDALRPEVERQRRLAEGCE